jgi:hypothetical protein
MNTNPESVTDKQSTLNILRKAVTPCPKCKRPLPPGEPVYHLVDYEQRTFEAYCSACFEKRARSQLTAYDGDLEKAKRGMLTRYSKVPNHREFTCCECKRPVWKRPRAGNPRVFCTTDCSNRFYSRMALRKRNSGFNSQVSTCNACGGAIPANRRGDVRYCSPACRQKAYRQRQQGEPA